ncbi:cytochrome P450 2J4-like [Littorina saxatilis]|uniref:Cytochrome P450 n=1 Tax=Littorina saxatilis TaxID=31220 RepID=A0AAN9ATQ5_9CAEN
MLDTILGALDTTSVFVFLLVFLIGYYWLTSPKNMPPGPMGLPLIGNLLQLRAAGSNQLELLKKWRQQYGDVFAIRLGSKNLVFISDYKILQETFVKNGDIFSGRPSNLYIINQIKKKTGTGVILSEGAIWKELRRVTLMTMRDFGVGKKSLEQRVLDEALAVVEVLEKGEGQPVLFKPLLSKFACNVICSIILGDRFDYDDKTFIELTKLVNLAVSQPLVFAPVNFLPITRFAPAGKKIIHDVVDSFVTIDNFLGTVLKEHEETYDPSEIRDFVDFYIKTRSDSDDAHLYDASNMRRVIIDLFAAGTETTATTLSWILLYFAAYPEVQTRCQQDIDKVVGQGRSATMDDRKNLPYIEAVITEIFRVVNIAPVAVPHVAVKEGKIRQYTVPAETIVIGNIREIHLDPVNWPEPDIFKPERFLDKDGNFCPPKKNFMPFSIGPRACLGEVLARMETFLLFCTLVQSFTFVMPQGQKPDLQGQFGVTYSGKPQPFLAKRR